MRAPEQQNVALECLGHAAKIWGNSPAKEIVAGASVFLAFVTGESRDESEARLVLVERALAAKPKTESEAPR